MKTKDESIEYFVPGSWAIEVLEKEIKKQTRNMHDATNDAEHMKADRNWIKKIDKYWDRKKDCENAIVIIKNNMQ